MEIEYIIYTLKQTFNPCNIIAVGDFNKNILNLDPDENNYQFGLRIVHPN